MSHQTFDSYMSKVNKILVDLTGLTADDLPDWNGWEESHELGTPVEQAVEYYFEDSEQDDLLLQLETYLEGRSCK